MEHSSSERGPGQEPSQDQDIEHLKSLMDVVRMAMGDALSPKEDRAIRRKGDLRDSVHIERGFGMTILPAESHVRAAAEIIRRARQTGNL